MLHLSSPSLLYLSSLLYQYTIEFYFSQVMGYWFFGQIWCSFYLALDVLFCTSSIVHLCAISLDRYWSVTEAVSYNRKRTPKRIKVMISIVWLISIVVSSPPLLMTHKDESLETEDKHNAQRQKCLLNNQTWYILSSCLVSFFAPGVIMILVYCKIYRFAKQRASTVFVAKNVMERQPSQSETCFNGSSRTFQKKGAECFECQFELSSSQPVNRRSSSNIESRSGGHRGGELDDIDIEEKICRADIKTLSSSLRFPKRGSRNMNEQEGRDAERRATSRLKPPPPSSCTSMSWASSEHFSSHCFLPSPVPVRSRQMSLPMHKVAQMREKRFTFVLAVVMGVFVLCWFPFFFTYSLHAVCRENCTIPDTLFNLFFWIGYCNSCLNPIIYTVFNRDFRRAFKKILFHTQKWPWWGRSKPVYTVLS